MWKKAAWAFLLPASLLCAEGPYLFRKPALSKTQIAFSFAGDLWIVSRSGGAAVRLTSGPGLETDPYFSPDSTQIALTGEYDGNVDVFVMPASGGVPRRLTSHPGVDVAVGWSADGKQVLFRSARSNPNGLPRLFAAPVEGGFPTEYPLPTVAAASFSPDGSQIAYVPLESAFSAWKRYRGGRAMPIWLAKLSDSSVVKLPRKDSNDFNPMWIGDRVYFLSDRNGPVTLFSYDVKSKKITQAIENRGLDIKSASAGPGAIVYEQFGSLNLYDLKTGKAQKVEIELNGDLPGVRPRLEKAAKSLRSFSLSPTGVRALFEARGEIFTIPAEKGDARNLTRSPGVADRDPAWSPDGKWIAYFSDESGEYMLHLREQSGVGEVKKIGLGAPPSFYYSPVWSPDSKKIAYTDKRTQLWYVDLEKKTPVRVDNGTYASSEQLMNPHWSPDSRWIAYVKQLKNRLGAVKLYSLETEQSTQVTDGLSDAQEACFDKSGKYLYFAASTDSGPGAFGLDMSSRNRPVTHSVYLVVLRKDLPSPLAPESDEEKIAEEKKVEKQDEKKEDKKDDKADAKQVSIDLADIGQRIIPLPIPARNYVRLSTGKEGILFVFEAPSIAEGSGPSSRILHKFDLSKRKVERFLDGLAVFDVSFNGEKIIFRQGTRWAIAGTATPPKAGDGTLKIEEIELFVDPRAEWRQMYKEVWRIERDFFYDPHYHGLDLQASGERYEKFLANLGSRADLNYLFQEMLGELSVGHLYVQGGDVPQAEKVKGGLLGADYKIENGRYRFARVYSGENWNPETRAPLTQPGVNVAAGDYLLAVAGRELRASEEIYSFFEGTAGRSISIRVGPDAGGAGARDVTVVPIESESGLRTLAWMEDNRRKVDQMSGGRLAYIHLPDTAGQGYTYFNRYYFAQVDKQGAVIDERFNRGGQAADYIIDHLKRTLLNYWTPRDGADDTTPAMAIFGPKVMIVNEYAGSGGDLLPWYFRRAGIGPLVGKRTWGGLVGIGGYPRLIDGGTVTAPHFAFWNPDGKWEVENHGTDPDIEVEFDPKAWREGKDPQLEKAVQVALEALEKNPPPAHKKPEYPLYHKREVVKGGAE